MLTQDSLIKTVEFLKELEDLYDNVLVDGCPENQKDHADLKICIEHIESLAGQWEKRIAIGNHRHAAKILARMLKAWRLPGGVCYRPSNDSFRLVGEKYTLRRNEIFIGVYSPDVSPELIYEDIVFSTKELQKCSKA